MKNTVLRGVCLSVSLLVSSPIAAQAADAVVTWNENAAKAAKAACLQSAGTAWSNPGCTRWCTPPSTTR